MDLCCLPSALAALVAAFALPSGAQYPPPPTYQSVLKSPVNADITVSFKEPDPGTCTSAFTTQRQYTGYIHLPPYTLAPIQQDYSINTFFWFVEARQLPESAPLTIWLNGGPGSSSMFGLFNEIGPCEVVQLNDGSYGTQYRMWGWDRSSNMLFIDQPNLVGFSYDTATNASINLFNGMVYEPPTPPDSSLPSWMYLNGTFGTASSNDSDPWADTANTTEIAAQATWHFLQAWLAAFPQYNPVTRPNVTGNEWTKWVNAPIGVNLFCESYGGKYAPAFANFFMQQNELRSNGSISSNNTLAIQLESVGIVNGLIDDLIQDAYYPQFAYNNTYGIQAISQTQELNDIGIFQNQCLPQIQTCRAAMAAGDPEGYGDNSTVNSLCSEAQWTCNNLTLAYVEAGYDVYDIRQMMPSPDPPMAYAEYLNNAGVLSSIGAAVNYSESNPYVQEGFISTGDTIRGGGVEDLAYLLSLGIRVALIYGDADFICNWYGGEAVSLAIAAAMVNVTTPNNEAVDQSNYATDFPAAGYAFIATNQSYVGGEVRQYGNLSFSRIYEAGHFVAFFQPETAFTVFTRIIEGTEIATGQFIDLSSFSSNGSPNATVTDSVPPAPSQTCWLRSWNSTCSDADTAAMLAGKGVVSNGIFYQNQASISLPSSSISAGVPGRPVGSSSSETGRPGMSDSGLTGVYTATGVPTSTTTGAAVRPLPMMETHLGFVTALALSLGLGVVMII